jgi:indolepyruvate ferredoxin oxidoreductase
MRFLRGGALDPFGKTAECRMERWLIANYGTTLDELIAGLDGENHALAIDIAAVPEYVRGYGHGPDREKSRLRLRRRPRAIGYPRLRRRDGEDHLRSCS